MSRPERPLVIAHRGASLRCPENTLPAFALAVEMRADMIEIDLHRTCDGVVVVAHDDDLTGLGGRGRIGDATRAEVAALDAGEGQCVPTLDEVLDAFGGRVDFNLEIKCPEIGPYPELEALALGAVRRRGLLERTLFSSFSDAVLWRLRELEPRARIAALVSPRNCERALERARALGAEALNPWRGLVDAGEVAAAHAASLAVYPFTVDEPDEMERLLGLGCDGLFTNAPDRLRGLVDARYPAGREPASPEGRSVASTPRARK